MTDITRRLERTADFYESQVMNKDDEGGGHWVTLDDGRHVFIGGDNPSRELRELPKFTSERITITGGFDDKDLSPHISPPQEVTANAEINEAYTNYTSSGYHEMNALLRGEDPSIYSSEPVENISRRTEILNSLIQNQEPLPEGQILYRGVGEKTAQKFLDVEAGSICEDKAFQSFSVDPKEASGFTTPIMTTTPFTKEFDAVVLRGVTSGTQKGIGGVSKEKEIIMSPGTKWKIVGKETIKNENNDSALGKKMIFRIHIITMVGV